MTLLIACSIASCGNTPSGPATPDSGSENAGFNTGKVTLTSAYSKAQDLGFEGTLEEFIEMISGKDGKDGVGIEEVKINNDGELTVVLSSGEIINCGNVKGADGADGITPTFRVEDGVLKVSYDNGKNWTTLANIQGADGANGTNGTDGKDGATPVLKVENGVLFASYDKGVSWSSLGVVKGEDGENGANGENGTNGTNGTNGITPEFKIESGELFVSYDKGVSWSSLGVVKGEDGENGANGANGTNGTNGTNGITPEFKIENGELFVSYDKGESWSSLGVVKEENGANGANGTNGKDGATIEKVEFDEEGRLVITLTNGTVLDPVELPKKEEHVHTFGDWINYAGNLNISCENRLFYRICTECKIIEWQSGSYEHHTFVTKTIAATCTAIGYDERTCTICGAVEILNETPVLGHVYPEHYAFDAEYHWKECTACGEANAKEAHIMEGEICIVCDPSVQPTEGILYEASLDGTYAEVLGYSGTATNIRIADKYMGLPVQNICNSAFRANQNITGVVIPDSVTSIGEGAFRNCSSLTSVVIGDSVTSIGERAFESCESLTSLVIGDSVTSIGSTAFLNCSSLASVVIPDSVTSIGWSAFLCCWSLTSVVIPDSVTSIGSDAFYGCSSLTSVTFDSGCAASVESSAFGGCSSALYTEYEFGKYIGDSNNPYQILIGLTNSNFTTYTIHKDTQIIASDVFKSCNRLTNISIPDSVTSISGYAFYDCGSLTSVVIGDSVTSIENEAFCNCSSLTSVVIPDSVTSIGNEAFCNCSSLTSVVIGDSVPSIGDEAFRNCSSLTSVVIPDSVTSIGSDAFYGCSSINDVYFTGTEEEWDNIVLEGGNQYLTDATIHLGYVPKE